MEDKPQKLNKPLSLSKLNITTLKRMLDNIATIGEEHRPMIEKRIESLRKKNIKPVKTPSPKSDTEKTPFEILKDYFENENENKPEIKNTMANHIKNHIQPPTMKNEYSIEEIPIDVETQTDRPGLNLEDYEIVEVVVKYIKKKI